MIHHTTELLYHLGECRSQTKEYSEGTTDNIRDQGGYCSDNRHFYSSDPPSPPRNKRTSSSDSEYRRKGHDDGRGKGQGSEARLEQRDQIGEEGNRAGQDERDKHNESAKPWTPLFGGDSQLVPHHSLYPDLLVRGDYLDRPFKILTLKALVGENFPDLFLLKLGKSFCLILFPSTMLLPELLLRLRP